MTRWFAGRPSATPRSQPPGRRGARTPSLVAAPARNRRVDLERRAAVDAMLAAIDDPDERAEFLRNVRSQPRELLPR